MSNNYLYGNCVISIEGDENIYSVLPYSTRAELVKNTGYLKDGLVYIYRGDISKKKKFTNGLFTDKKGNRMFAMGEDDKNHFTFENIQDDSIHSIVEQTKRINPKLKKKIMKEINKSSDIYSPEIDENDDFLKHLIKQIVLEKKIDLKDHRDKFKRVHDSSNLKASLEAKTSPDGKRGTLTINNLMKWMEVLDMDIEVIFKDSPTSEDPCFKQFKYSGTEGYSVSTEDGYSESDGEDDLDEDDDE